MPLTDNIKGHESVRTLRDYSQANVWRELWEFRELLYLLAWRDITIRYRQTVLGILWAFAQPFFTMVIYTFVFGQIANIPSDGMPRPIFYFSALLPWLFFSATLNNAGSSLVANSHLLTKIYFPRLILPISAALVPLADFLIGCLFFVFLLWFYDLPIVRTLLLWPLFVVPLGILAIGAGSLLAALNVKYRDVKHAIGFGIQALLFVTPIIYPASVFPESYRWLLDLNPLTGFIEGLRYSIMPTYPFEWTAWMYSGVVTLVVLLGGVTYFRSTERAFADII